jgi:hypothetical protein
MGRSLGTREVGIYILEEKNGSIGAVRGNLLL